MNQACDKCGSPIFPEVRLRGMYKDIYEYIFRRKLVESSDLLDYIYRNRSDGGPENSRQVMHVMVHNLNKKLKPHGVRIKGMPGRGNGYYSIERISQ